MFKIGDKVICKDESMFSYNEEFIIKGQSYDSSFWFYLRKLDDSYCVWVHQNYLIKKEEEDKMDKSMLKTGHILLSKDGEYRIVLLDCYNGNGKYINVSNRSHGGLYSFNDDLTSKSVNEHTIMKIYEPRTTCDLISLFNISNYHENLLDHASLIWEREDPQKKELKEIIENLKGQLKEAQDKLDKM